MVRRVGFGDAGSGGADRPPKVASASDPAPLPEDTGPAKNHSWARWVVVFFLLAWVAAWGYALIFGLSAISEVWERGDGGAFDIGALGFIAIWMVGAGVAWAFGVVILVVMLFGKPMSPERRAQKEAMRRARAAERESR